MAVLQKTLAVAVAAGSLFAAKAASADMGVVFIHGTSNQTVATATNDYWTQGSIDAHRAGRPYTVVGYAGADCDSTGKDMAGADCNSWQTIADQIDAWLTANPNISDIQLITHSNGINPTRYLLAHQTARASAARVAAKTRKVIAEAGSMKGTPLADKVFQLMSNSFIGWMVAPLVGDYGKAAVRLQQTTQMAAANANGTFGATPNYGGVTYTVSGVPLETIVGTGVNAKFWSKDAYCEGYGYQAALWALTAIGFISSYSDGFIEVGSSTYMGTNQYAQVVSHHQNRRNCKGVAGAVAARLASTPVGAPPADQTQSGAGLACNVTGRTIGSSNQIQFYGCVGSMSYDSATDTDCVIAYGQDNGVAAISGYNSTKYPSVTSCPDSWRGDGMCDLCIVAKYGTDAKDGWNGADDCAWQPGVNTSCSDFAYDTCATTNFWGSCKGGDRYVTYTAIH